MSLHNTRSLAVTLGLCAAALAACGSTVQAREPSPSELQSRLAHVELVAGLTPVEGPGLAVTLRDSPRTAPKGTDPAKLRVRGEDVNAVVDALRAAGAEALAISGADGVVERVLAGTAAREADGTILINRTPVRAPLRVLAIGDTQALREELLRPNGVVRRSGLETLGMIAIEESANLALPAGHEEASPRYARIPEARKPEPVKTERQPEASPAVTRPDSPASGSTLFFSGPASNKYHRAGCRFGERIDRSQRVTFHAAAEAQAGAKVPCPICRPDQVK